MTRRGHPVGLLIRPAPELPGGRLYRVRRANTSNVRATTQRYFSFFAQDTWQVGNLTLRPGVRYEQQTLRGDDTVRLCRVGETRPGRGEPDPRGGREHPARAVRRGAATATPPPRARRATGTHRATRPTASPHRVGVRIGTRIRTGPRTASPNRTRTGPPPGIPDRPRP